MAKKSSKQKGGKTAKKSTAKKKVAKKTVKKVAKKVAKKVVKKVAKKVSKVAKKVSKKPAKKVVKKPTVKVKTAKKNVSKTKTTKKATPKAKTTKTATATTAPTQTATPTISGKNFLFTGTLSQLTRKDAEQSVKDHGGKVLSGVGDKLDYLVAGEKAGSKLKEAKKHKNVKVIGESDFIMMTKGGSDEGQGQGTDAKVNYKIKFDIYGYGAENCVTSLSKEQIAYWKKKYKEDEYEAQQELKDHLWNYEYDDDIPETHFGKWYDQDSIVHAERAGYSESSRLMITVLKDGEEVEEIDIPVTDSKIKKEFFDEFVPSKKRNKGEAYLWTHSTDRGSYCHGEYEIPDGKPFDLSKITLIVKNIFDEGFVWNLCYEDEYLEDEGCYDSTGKGFDANIYFF